MHKIIGTLIVSSIAAVSLIACNSSTIPGECLDAMEEHNIPENVIELIKENAGGDLNYLQRTALRLAFEKAGVDDLRGEFAE